MAEHLEFQVDLLYVTTIHGWDLRQMKKNCVAAGIQVGNWKAGFRSYHVKKDCTA